MKKLILIFVVSICFMDAQNPTFDWVNSINGLNQQYINSICHDATGNIFVTGRYSGVTNFAATNSLTAIGIEDAYIAKYNSSGVIQWANNFGASGKTCDGMKIISDNAGNCYVIGYFEGSVDFDPSASNFVLNSNGSFDVFVAKYSSSGAFIWAFNLGGTNMDMGMSIEFDNQGNIVVGGIFRSTVDFDPSPSTYTLSSVGTGEFDGFFAKYNPNGTLMWAKSVGGDNLLGEWVRDIKVDATNNIYVVGYYTGTIDLDPTITAYNLVSNGNYDIYLAKYDANGNILWGHSFGGANFDYCERFEITPSGSIYMTGNFQNVIDLDPSPSTYTVGSTGQADMFIAKYSTNGDLIFANAIGGVGTDYLNAIKIDLDSNIYITGMTFGNTIDFDPSPNTYTINSSLQEDAFIAKYNHLGNVIWAYGIPSAGTDFGKAVDVLNSNIYFVGQFSDIIDFDMSAATYTLNSEGGFDGYILKLSQCITPNAALNTTPPVNQMICTGQTTTLSASAPTGTISWYATPSSTNALGTGSVFVTPTLSTGTYTFYAEVETCTTSINRTGITVSVSACTGVNEDLVLTDNIGAIYPNPSNGKYNIQVAVNVNFVLYNSMGTKIIEGALLEGVNQIDISSHSNGIYFLHCFDINSTKNIKIIKN